MKKRQLLLVALAALAITPVALPVGSTSVYAIQEADQTQGKQMLALGGSLSAQQSQQTISLLGAGSVTPENTIYVDGDMINRYLNDGSNASTSVYSSAYIQPQAQGSGVRVEIVTPENITAVSTTTYQNAAITAGAKDALVRIGTVTPVTGEGALTGLYALLEEQGVAINQQDVQTAQKEITVVNNVKDDTGLTDDQVNIIIAEIKKEVAVQSQNNGQINTTEIVNTVVNNVTNNTTINGDGNVVDNSNETNITISNETKQELEQYADEFAQTDAASNEETVQQLDASMEDKDWSAVLPGLEATMSLEDILAQGPADFSDSDKFHPIIPAMFDAFYAKAEEGTRIDDLYAHTFILEKMQPELSTESRAALDQLRELMFQYTTATSENPDTIRDQWVQKLQAANSLRTSDPVLAEIVQLTANATGYAPEVYTYMEFEQEGKVISFTVAEDSPEKLTVLARYQYDLETQTLSEVDEISMEPAPMATDTFDFASVYGVAVENLYVPSVEILPDYTIPGYVPEETTEEETSNEESTVDESTMEETTQETSSDEEPVETTESTLEETSVDEEAGL
ncbi:DUF1002 domain-containing protein [Facklamia sp. DSM 111018]|uniref:DUF1002 domain-containing protein n=1 Tax=Facklamia lactis TaxID=2749967 RepID=A0ABS0LTP0_9LACT|nr:DUF1002 domain-containing protein [Facklamia lactis]MBG9986659.1 DUF1002 domain-containing protein [Facklamia lactis]